MNHIEEIHNRNIEAGKQYQTSEAKLIGALQENDRHRVFLHKGYSSLFLYVRRELGLSESTTYNLIAVVRASYKVPELKTEIEKGTITLSNARKIAPLLCEANKAEWLEKAATLSHRQLEKEIVRERPLEATREHMIYATPSRVKVELGLSEKDSFRLRKVQDLVSQAKRRSVSLEEALVVMMDEYLHRHDPVLKATRQVVKKGFAANPKQENLSTSVKTPVALQVNRAKKSGDREPIPAAIQHQVNLRDERKCVHINEKGERCGATRFLEVHHIQPVSVGGKNTLENLATLCSAHHSFIHDH